jgi:hypothetical protein
MQPQLHNYVHSENRIITQYSYATHRFIVSASTSYSSTLPYPYRVQPSSHLYSVLLRHSLSLSSTYASVSVSPCIDRYEYLWLYSPCEPWSLFQFLNPHTDGRTPWTGDQLVARSVPARRTTQTQNERTQTSIPRVGCEPTIRAGEDGSCLRPRGHCDRRR